ncbi:hypothetical protein FACS1894191_7930 [Clostridia bacterium]|nr:hypothetical protein FACS1894191_7930 [Clostridia bacterium]
MPLFAVIYNISRRIITHILRAKGKPTGTQDYASEKNPLLK